MSRMRLTLEVARWEFLRHIKVKQQVIGALVTLAVLLGATYLVRFATERERTVELAVAGAEHLPGLETETGRFQLELHDAAAADALQADVERGERDALLVLGPDGDAALHARRPPPWQAELERELSATRQAHRIAEAGVDPDVLAAILEPVELTVHETVPGGGREERIVALLAIGLLFTGLLTGIAYVLASITGEKQNRIAEQVVSAIPAQVWIDGKIAGLSAVSIASIGGFVAAGLAYVVISGVGAGLLMAAPAAFARPHILALALGLALLGFLFWFSFFAAIAALIDDPYTSNKGSLLFVPMLFAVPALLAVADPDATWLVVLGLVTPTSAVVLPARILVTDVAWWEPLVATALLLVAIGAMRRAAGKVFRLGMLMYGKEPSWGEVRRWIREA